MPSHPSASNAANSSPENIVPLFMALVRVYDRVMRHRVTPFSVPQEGMDPLIPLEGIPKTVHHPDPEANVVSVESVFTGLDLEDPEVKATRQMLLEVHAAQERMSHGLAIQPEFEPFSTLPLEHRGDRLVRQVKEITVLQPVRSEVVTRKKDTFTGRPSMEVTYQTQIRNMRWKTDQLLAGKTVWPAEPLLVMVTTDIQTFLQTLEAPVFPLSPWRAVESKGGPGKSWDMERVPGPIIPHQMAMVELIGLFSMDIIPFEDAKLSLHPKVRKKWLESDMLGAQRQIMELLERALTPPGGLPQTCWVPGWDY